MRNDAFRCDMVGKNKECTVEFKPCETVKQLNVNLDMSSCIYPIPIPYCPLPLDKCHDECHKHHHKHRYHHKHHRKHRHKKEKECREKCDEKPCNNNFLFILLAVLLIRYFNSKCRED